jgi:hypothetical protein
VAAGASKAALSVHFAKHDNLAELNAKEASQETAVGLIGLLVGTLVVKVVQDHQSVVFLMIILVFAHLWMNYLGVRSVCMTTLNRQRATLLLGEYMKTGRVLSPTEVAARESIIFWLPVVRNRHGEPICRIEFAESYQKASQGLRQALVQVSDGEMYTSFVTEPRNGSVGSIKMLLWFGCEPRHAILGWFTAVEAAWWMNQNGVRTAEGDSVLKQRSASDEKLWDTLGRLGWNLETQAFETKAPVRLRVQSIERKDS